MAGGGELTKVAESERHGIHGIRLMLVRAHGCRICVALDAVEGIFDLARDGDADASSFVADASVRVVDWAEVTGVGCDPATDEARHVMVLRTAIGLVGLRVDACLGVRTVSLSRTPPMPTRLTDPSGSPLCFLLMLDGRPHLMLEPRGLVARVGRENSVDGAAAALDGAGAAGLEAGPS